MSTIRLLVLGAVRQHGRAHGYQVRNDLEYWGAHEWSNAKPGSIYHALKQLAKQGLLVAHEIAPSTALTGEQKRRLASLHGDRVTAVAQDTRGQARNREIAVERLRRRLAAAAAPRKHRRATKPGRAAKERRLDSKRRQGERKRARRRPALDE